MRSELRKDYIQEKFVIIAPRRDERPHDVRVSEPQKVRSASCAFDPGHEGHPRGIFCMRENGQGECLGTDDPTWRIKVVANKFPSVSLDNPACYGQQEVVIETPDHGVSFEDLSEDHIAHILRVYGERTVEITKNEKIEYVLIFKNQGGRAGASLEHAHSQIFATDFIPPHLIDKSQRVQRYKLERGSCVYCDVIKQEETGPRLVYKDNEVIAFCPYASMYNYEVWIMPFEHLDNITLLQPTQRIAWARALKRVLPKIVALGLDYNYYFHQVVNDEDQHFYMKITPRGSVWAGVEIGSGVVINPVAPEDAALYFRQ